MPVFNNFIKKLRAKNINVEEIDVNIPLHSRYMINAAALFQQYLEQVLNNFRNCLFKKKKFHLELKLDQY